MTATESLSRAHLTRMFQKFSRAGVAVLVSDDAGSRTWGEPKALEYLAEVREAAIQEFAFSGNTYTMGYSMGGLPALLVAFKAVFPVSGVLLLDARVNLMDAWQAGDVGRREEIARAYGLATTDPLPFGADPVNDFYDARTRALPLFVAGSPDDQTVPLRYNGEALLARNTSRETRFHLLSGPHLGASHFADAVTDAMLAFVDRQEHVARAAKRNDARRRTTSRPEAVLQKKP